MQTKRKGIAVAAAVAAFLGQLAYAHTDLSGSMPADGAVLESAPGDVTLHFSDPVRLTIVTIEREGESKQSLGPLPSDPAERFVLSAPGLTEGRYTVSWRALSEDTHVMTGELNFEVAGGAGETTGQEHHAAPAQPSPSQHSGH